MRFNASNSRQGRSNPYRQRRKSFDLAVILLNVTRMKQLIRIGVVVSSFGALALTAFAGSETYSGKEMKQVAPAPPPECDYTWTGFYVGAHVGYGWGNADTAFNPLPNAVSFTDLAVQSLRPEPDGVIAGGQLGYNYQFWHCLVLGAEADFSWNDMSDTVRRSPFDNHAGAPFNGTLTAHQDYDWFGTGRLKLGFSPFCRVLLYGTGGLAYGDVHYRANSDFTPQGTIQYPTSFSETKVGWTAGAGAEYAITHRWSIKVEYLYFDLGDENRVANPVPVHPPFQVRYDFRTQGQTVNAGLNFHF